MENGRFVLRFSDKKIRNFDFLDVGMFAVPAHTADGSRKRMFRIIIYIIHNIYTIKSILNSLMLFLMFLPVF